MSSSRRFPPGLVLLVCLVAGCGDQKGGSAGSGGGGAASATPRAAAPEAILDLLPEGTVGVVYVPNVKALEDGVRRLAATTGDRRLAAKADIAKIIGELGVNAGDLDLTRPAAFAATLGSNRPEPVPTLIFAVKNESAIAGKVKARIPRAVVETAGGFAAVAPEGGYKRGTSPAQLRAPFPAGDVAVRLDVAALWRKFGPRVLTAVESELEWKRKGSEPAAALAQPVVDQARSILDAASVLDLAVRIDGTAVEIDASLRFADAAKAKALDLFAPADLRGLAGFAPEEGMLSFAAAVNPQKMWAAIEPAVSVALGAAPDSHRATVQEILATVGQAMKTLKSGVAMTGGLKDGRFEMTGALESSDPGVYIKALSDVTTKVAGINVENSPVIATPLEERTIEGTKVSTVRLNLDRRQLPETRERETLTRMLGPTGLTYNFVPSGTRIGFVVGGDDTLKRTLAATKAGPSSSPLAIALGAAGSDTVGYMRLDLAAVMRETLAIRDRSRADPMPRPPMPELSEPLNVTCILNAGPDEVRLRLSADVGRAMKLFEAMNK